MRPLILASASLIRAELLRKAGLRVIVEPARVDEHALRAGLLAEGATPRDIADALAEQKALRVARKIAGSLVLGCDQVMVFDGEVLSKPPDLEALRARLVALRGREHQLFSAAVLYDAGQPVWRHIAEARLTMRQFSDSFVDRYMTEIEQEILYTVGGYAIEGLGIQLFQEIEGDHFGILGLPLIPLLNALQRRGDILS